MSPWPPSLFAAPVAHSARVLAASLALAIGGCCAGVADAGEPPLVELPADKLAQMAPLLRHGEVALIESLPSGRMKQVTIMSLVAAPPDVVRSVAAMPEKWVEFIPNVSRCIVHRHPDGSIDYDFALDLKLLSLDTNYHMTLPADGSIEIRDNDGRDHTTQLWRFIAVPGGTVMVQYGYTDIYHSNKYVRRVVDAAPLTEHGLALAAQLAYARAMKVRAEHLATPGSFPPADLKARGPGFGFLLQRGRVAVIRTRGDGHLEDISILDDVYAPVDRVLSVLTGAADYDKFLDGVKRSRVTHNEGDEIDYELAQDLSVVHLDSGFRMHHAANAVDVVGDSGDQRSSHFRWDLTSKGERHTLVVYRANQDLASASPLILGTIFRMAPFFEPGVAVAIGLIYVVGVRGRAEGWR